MVPPQTAATPVAAGKPLHGPADIAAARERAKRRAAAIKLVRRDLESLIRSNHPQAGAVRQLLDAYNVSTAEADVYREMFGAIAYPRVPS